jgi:Protein of unknown function (DUF3305)
METTMVEHEITVGLVIERLAPSNVWGEPIWLPLQVLQGVPDAPPWTVLAQATDRVRYFAGAFAVKLYSTETAFYRDNLTAEQAKLWVAMQPQGAEPPVEILCVTADPTEGEGYTQTGTNVVEAIAMPDWMAAEIAAFVTAHHVERVFEKRKRDKRPSGFVERRGPGGGPGGGTGGPGDGRSGDGGR